MTGPDGVLPTPANFKELIIRNLKVVNSGSEDQAAVDDNFITGKTA